MKKLLFFLFTLVVLASGCGKKNTFTLEGSIKGLPSDTILVFYQEPDYKLDTILLSKGKFTYTITLTHLLSSHYYWEKNKSYRYMLIKEKVLP